MLLSCTFVLQPVLVKGFAELKVITRVCCFRIGHLKSELSRLAPELASGPDRSADLPGPVLDTNIRPGCWKCPEF